MRGEPGSLPFEKSIFLSISTFPWQKWVLFLDKVLLQYLALMRLKPYLSRHHAKTCYPSPKPTLTLTSRLGQNAIICWNKLNRLHKKRIQHPHDYFGHQHGPPVVVLGDQHGRRDVMSKGSLSQAISYQKTSTFILCLIFSLVFWVW